MMKKKRDRITYKRNWRQVEKKRKWENSFIAEYTRLKFANIYHEAQCFYKALEQLYPNKDVKRTSEFVSWKKSLEQDSQRPIIVQHMYTTTHEEKVVENDTETRTARSKPAIPKTRTARSKPAIPKTRTARSKPAIPKTRTVRTKATTKNPSTARKKLSKTLSPTIWSSIFP